MLEVRNIMDNPELNCGYRILEFIFLMRGPGSWLFSFRNNLQKNTLYRGDSRSHPVLSWRDRRYERKIPPHRGPHLTGTGQYWPTRIWPLLLIRLYNCHRLFQSEQRIRTGKGLYRP